MAFHRKSKSKNHLPTSPKIIKKNRNLTKLPYDNDSRCGPGSMYGVVSYGCDDSVPKGHHAPQHSVRMSKSFNNSSLNLNVPPSSQNHNAMSVNNYENQMAITHTERNGGGVPTHSNFRSSGQLALSLSMSGSLISPSMTGENATHDPVEAAEIKVNYGLQVEKNAGNVSRQRVKKCSTDLSIPLYI